MCHVISRCVVLSHRPTCLVPSPTHPLVALGHADGYVQLLAVTVDDTTATAAAAADNNSADRGARK